MTTRRKTIVIAGAGRMGRGIALSFAYQGHKVALVDIKDRNNEEIRNLKNESIEEIKKQLKILVSSKVVSSNIGNSIIDRITIYHINEGIEVFRQADVVFEAVPEILTLKKKVFDHICPYLSDKALVASVTSSFSANQLVEYVPNKKRFMNTHWLNPAYLIPLIEVSPSNKTSDLSLKGMFELLESIGKVPIKCSPSPGFIVPRIQALAMNEASRLVEEEVASIEDIDKASRLGFGLRFAILGLLEFIDWGGSDTLVHASQYLKDSLESDRFSTSEIVEKKMKAGDIGLKANKGFYNFSETNIDEYQQETLQKFIDLLQHLGYLVPPYEEK